MNWIEIDIKQLESMWPGRDHRRCTRNGCIAVHAAVIASNLSIEIKEGHVVGGDREADCLRCRCDQRARQNRCLECAQVVRACPVRRKEGIIRERKQNDLTTRHDNIGGATRTSIVESWTPPGDLVIIEKIFWSIDVPAHCRCAGVIYRKPVCPEHGLHIVGADAAQKAVSIPVRCCNGVIGDVHGRRATRARCRQLQCLTRKGHVIPVATVRDGNGVCAHAEFAQRNRNRTAGECRRMWCSTIDGIAHAAGGGRDRRERS